MKIRLWNFLGNDLKDTFRWQKILIGVIIAFCIPLLFLISFIISSFTPFASTLTHEYFLQYFEDTLYQINIVGGVLCLRQFYLIFL